MQNKVQLIAYVDRLSGGNIQSLRQLMQTHFTGLFDAIHILPFFNKIDGSDAGFDPIDHLSVDHRLGNWSDIAEFGQDMALMADMIVNHVSADSSMFQDVLKHGKKSAYWPMFLRRDAVFAKGEADPHIQSIFLTKSDACFTDYQVAQEGPQAFWTTFTDSQIDLDVTSQQAKHYLSQLMQKFAQHNIRYIRLDAAGFACKKAGTSCFMLDETFEFINQLSEQARAVNMQCLAEVHSHYQTLIDIAKRVDRIYDFALPALVLHTLYNKDPAPLNHWLTIAPANSVTVLDTHDGIGVADAGPYEDKAGLLSQQQLEKLVQKIHEKTSGQSLKASGTAASNVDEFQVNTTYYDALGRDDHLYLIARAIQFFSPGVPQVYYMGLLALENDMQLLAETNVGRDINRAYIDEKIVTQAMQKPVVKALCQLIRLRNQLQVFNGQFSCNSSDTKLSLSWSKIQEKATLTVDLRQMQAFIELKLCERQERYRLEDWLTAAPQMQGIIE